MLMIFTARIMHMCYERMWPTYRYIHALYISAAIFSHYWLVWVSLRLTPISKYAFKSLQVAKRIYIAVWKVFTFWCSHRHTLTYSLTKEYCKPAEANDVPHTWNFRQATCPFRHKNVYQCSQGHHILYIIITKLMNAQECKTLTAIRMHDSFTCRSIVAS